jgi:hypothetical protein
MPSLGGDGICGTAGSDGCIATILGPHEIARDTSDRQNKYLIFIVGFSFKNKQITVAPTLLQKTVTPQEGDQRGVELFDAFLTQVILIEKVSSVIHCHQLVEIVVLPFTRQH